MTTPDPWRALAEGILLAARAGRFAGDPPTPGGVSDLGEVLRDDLYVDPGEAAARDRREEERVSKVWGWMP